MLKERSFIVVTNVQVVNRLNSMGGVKRTTESTAALVTPAVSLKNSNSVI